MPNVSSRAGHVPHRTCVICRKKTTLDSLIRFVVVDSEIVFDLKRRLATRGYYVCNTNECLMKIDKWLIKRRKKKKNERRRKKSSVSAASGKKSR